MNKQLEAIKAIGTEIFSKEEVFELSKKVYPLTCDISLQGLVDRILSDYSYSTALLILRTQYGIVRYSKTKVICIDKSSTFESVSAHIRSNSW